MIQRTQQPCPGYKKAIEIDPRWFSYMDFFLDIGERPAGMTLDRIDNEKGYCKANCRWATPQQQSENRRNVILVAYLDEQVTLAEYARRTGMSKSTVHRRYHAGTL